MTRWMVELFAGTGTVATAFRSIGWEATTVDNDPETAPDVLADLSAGLPLLPQRPGFVWASPPCTEFSRANSRIDHGGKTPDLSLVFATLQAVATIRPRFWVLENVVGAIPFLGIPGQKVGPFCLWGYFPEIRVPYAAQIHRKAGLPTAAARGRIPQALAEAVADAVNKHRNTERILDLRPFRRHRHKAAKGRRAHGQLSILSPRQP